MAGSLDSRIIYKPSKGGEFKIIATCLDGKPGKYTLTVVEAGGADTVSMFKAKGTALKMVNGKYQFEGELTDQDAVAQNHYYKLFTVRLEKGKTYRIDHMSKDFDAYLFLEDPAGNKIAEDDDGGDNLNSRIVYKAAETANYRVIATTLPARKTGKFELIVGPGTKDDEEQAAFAERIASIAKSTPVERAKIVQEVTKRYQAKGADLTINDARQAFQIANAVEDADADLAKTTYQNFSKAFEGASNKQVASVARAFDAALKKMALIGSEIEIAGQLTTGKDFDLKKLKGKVVLVDFWATWCGPCIAELPNMQAAYAKYHGKGFEIIGISLDRPGDDEKLANFIENRKLPWACINIEDSRKLADRYAVQSIPFPVLVGADGRVVSYRARGPQLEILLERLLKDKK